MKKLLIVDDDPGILEIMQLVGAANGYATLTVQDGREAEKTVRSFQPDLVVLDYSIGDVYGSDLCKGLKGNAITKHIPIIICSGHVEAERIASECGANDFLSKPFSLADLVDKMRKFLE